MNVWKIVNFQVLGTVPVNTLLDEFYSIDLNARYKIMKFCFVRVPQWYRADFHTDRATTFDDHIKDGQNHSVKRSFS